MSIQKKEYFYCLFAVSIRKLLQCAAVTGDTVREVRMRVGRPILLNIMGNEYSITDAGQLTGHLIAGHTVSAPELDATMESITGYSLYAFDEEMKQGFLTVQGGHRIGVAGRIVTAGKQISCIRNVSFLNIRLSHEIHGCADTVLPHLLEDGKICHTLIISPPGCGKTTLLRDLIRQVSDGLGGCQGQTVGVVDERSELGGCWLGIPQNDLGMRTDILDCCPKAEGMLMLLRAMSPQVIAVDELGGSEDVEAVEHVFRCGCKLLATVHGSSLEDVCGKKQMELLMKRCSFERYVVLQIHEKQERAVRVLNQDGSLLYSGAVKQSDGIMGGC